MTKRHTVQNAKQSMGQYFTKNAERIMSGFESYVSGKDIIDPFSGEWDLLMWAKGNGSKSITGYDIDPKNSDTIRFDSLIQHADYTGRMVLTNPPYLSANKSKGKYKDVYSRWEQNDLYKCFLASLSRRNASEAIVIIPSNFLCESNSRARDTLFSDYDIVKAKYWREQVFDDATTGVCALYLKRSGDILCRGIQDFECEILPEGKTIRMVLEREFDYIHGGEELSKLNRSFDFERIEEDTEHVNTKIIVGCLDNGRYGLGFHMNSGPDIKVPKTVITTFQVNSVGISLTLDQQQRVVSLSNGRLFEMRKKYDGMFLSNYMGATQKIMSMNIAKTFLSDATKKVVDNVIESV
jgi:hypothetical protein